MRSRASSRLLLAVGIVLALLGGTAAQLAGGGPPVVASPGDPARAIAEVSSAIDVPITHAGIHRSYRVYVPPRSDRTAPMSLVLALHGRATFPAYHQTQTRLDPVAREHGFVVAYPEGFERSWNAGVCCEPATSNRIDDVGFLTAVVADIRGNLPIDRVFATGFSNGSMMAIRLACERPDLLTAIAPVHGTDTTETCAPQRPVHTLHVNGRLDIGVPYLGTPFSRALGVPVTAAPITVGRWERLNRCSGLPSVVVSGTVTTRTYTACAGGSTVRFVRLAETAHDWPSDHADSFEGAREIWDFFAPLQQAVSDPAPPEPELTTRIVAVRQPAPGGVAVVGEVTGRYDVVLGAPVVVDAATGASWRQVAAGTTDVEGAFTVRVRAPAGARLRVRYVGRGLPSSAPVL